MHSVYHGLPVLITGGCGFIGSHIAEQLVASGADVTILDDLSSGFLHNIEHIRKNVRFIQTSITNKDACLEAAKNQQLVFHLAAMISVPESIQNPALCHDINVTGTFNMLEAARINNVKKLVLSSSAAVYGNTTNLCHEHMLCQPESPYGFSKHIDELMCQEYSKVYGLETVILRYFNVWGPRQNPASTYAGVVAKFTQQMQLNQSITIFGDGLQMRDFIHVDQVVQANLMLASSNIGNGEIFNIATGASITLLDLVEKLKKEYPHYNQEIRFEPARAGDLKISQADCSKYNAFVKQG
jgi:UDP-glucose 4-epimerase